MRLSLAEFITIRYIALSRILFLVVAVCLLLPSTSSAQIPGLQTDTATSASKRHLEVVLLINNASNPFWQRVKTATQKAAKDLNISLQVIAINNNPLRPIRVLSALVNSNRKPDAVLFPNIKNTGKAVLDLLEQHKIHSIIYDNGFSPKDNMGNPGQFYRYWRGQVVVGNYEAGRQLTHKVAQKALKQFPNTRPLPMIVLEGTTSSQSNAQRLLGMFDALVSYKDQVEIRQIFSTRYDPEHAYNATLTARQRYPDVKIIWSANDAMALRAADAARETELIPGKDILIVGFDTLPAAREQITKGILFDSYGGHDMSAAWALVYLYDYLEGANEPFRKLHLPLSSGQQVFALEIPGTEPAKQLIPTDNFSNIDFSRFSKQLNSEHHEAPSSRYPFEEKNPP